MNALALLITAPFFGSFLGLVADRLPRAEPVIFARSACPSCHQSLNPRDLIPLVSWLSSRGKCRYCAAGLSAYYPIVELVAFLAAAWSLAVLPDWLAWAGAGLGWTLLALSIIDWRHRILPDALTLPLVAAGFVVAWVIDPDKLPDHVIGALAGYSFFFVITWIYRKLRGHDGLGLGDAKLLAAAGAWLSWQSLPSVILLAAVTALITAVTIGHAKATLSARMAVPFGPFLAIGFWLVWLYGPLSFGWAF